MNILIVGKWLPVQGGVCRETLDLVFCAVQAGHRIAVLTNASSISAGMRINLTSNDECFYKELSTDRLKIIDVCKEVRDAPYHIPYSPMFTTRLVGAGLKEIEKQPYDLILGSYLEPYGVAASALSKATGVPYVLRHAGSDIGRLALQSDIREFYANYFQDAVGMITVGSEKTIELLDAIGFKSDRLLPLVNQRWTRPTLPTNRSGGIDDILNNASETDYFRFLCGLVSPESLERLFILNPRNAGIRLGIYGKIGSWKGTPQLLQALKNLNESAEFENDIQLSIIPCCDEEYLPQFVRQIADDQTLSRCVSVFSPIAPWRIPDFIQSCDIGCFLENNFTVEIHSPGVPLEIARCGGVIAITNSQVLSYGWMRNLVDEKNCLILNDDNITDELVGKISKIRSDRLDIEYLKSNAAILRKMMNFDATLVGVNPLLQCIETIDL